MEVVGDGARDLHLRLWPEVHLGVQPRICTAVYSSVGALLNSSGPSTHLHVSLRPHIPSRYSSADPAPLSVAAVFCLFGLALNMRALDPLGLLDSFLMSSELEMLRKDSLDLKLLFIFLGFSIS